MTNHEILNGKVQLYRRGDSRIWQCSASVGGKQRRATTKQESLAHAKDVAEDWSTLDAASINVRRTEPSAARRQAVAAGQIEDE